MFLKPNAIVFIRHSDLIVSGKNITPAKMNYDPEIVSNLELLDADQFIDECKEFFEVHDLQGKKVLIVIGQNITFTKSLELTDSNKDNIESFTQNFVSSMPFEPGQRAYIQIETEGQIDIYATNSDLYLAVLEALRENGMRKLVAITPEIAYKLDYSALKISEAIEQFMEDKKIRKTINFSVD